MKNWCTGTPQAGSTFSGVPILNRKPPPARPRAYRSLSSERAAVQQPAAAGAETDRAATADMAIAAVHIAAAHGAPPRSTALSRSAVGRRQRDYRNRSFARSALTCRHCNQQGRTRSARAPRPASCHANEVTREHRPWLLTQRNKLV